MSRLQELIEELCPNGVEYKKLGEVCEIKRGVRITKAQVLQEGEGKYPVISGGMNPLGYLNDFNRDENTITIAKYGSAGFVNWQKEKFWANDVCYSLFPKEILDNRFLYYVLCNNQEYLYQLVNRDAIPYHLPQSHIEKLYIPVPPLVLQEEIVRILDHFTDLAAELQAELQVRKEQYEYYRNELLSFDKDAEGVKWMKMSELFNMRNGYTPSKAQPMYWENGTIPWFRMEDIRTNGRILSDSIQHITLEAVKGGKLFSANSFIIATTATIGEHALLIADSQANQQFTNLQVRKSLVDRINIKFLFYYMYIVGEWCKNNTNVSGFASVDMKKFKKLLIPIPPLAEQEHIASVLDKFETLVNNLTEGLPAEIAAVQEQYEYYRNQILSFPRKEYETV